MAVIYNASVKNTRMTAVLNAIDAESGFADIQIGTAGMASILATLPFDDPAGSVTTDTLTFDMPITDESAANTGTAAEARIRDASGTAVITGLTVGTAATDIVLNSTSISTGQQVTLNSGTIQHG